MRLKILLSSLGIVLLLVAYLAWQERQKYQSYLDQYPLKSLTLKAERVCLFDMTEQKDICCSQNSELFRRWEKISESLRQIQNLDGPCGSLMDDRLTLSGSGQQSLIEFYGLDYFGLKMCVRIGQQNFLFEDEGSYQGVYFSAEDLASKKYGEFKFLLKEMKEVCKP